MSTAALLYGLQWPLEPTSTILMVRASGMPARAAPPEEFARMSDRFSFPSTK
jgi:hypothetical protein